MKWLTLFLCALLMSVGTVAQTKAEKYGKKKAERAKNRTESRADSRVNQRVDQAVDGVFDGVEGLFKKKKKQKDNDDRDVEEGSENEAANPMAGMFGGKADTRDRYTYDLTISMQIDATDKKGKTETSSMDWLYAKGQTYTGGRMDVGKGMMGTTIMDLDKEVIVMITDESNAMVMSMKKAMARAEQYIVEENAEAADYSFRKTGKTKTVAGYLTHEFEYKDDETTTYMYMAPDLAEYGMFGTGFMNMMGQQNKKMPAVTGMESGEEMGLMLELDSTDKKGERIIMSATKVDTTPLSFEMSDYKIMSIPGM